MENCGADVFMGILNCCLVMLRVASSY